MAVLTQITSRSLADNAVSSAKIQDGAIAAADVGTNSITATELADDAVDTAALADGAVDADRLATNAVTTVKLASSAITKEKIAAEAIQVNPHIIPDVLYPAVAGKDLSGTALGGSYTYGTAHTDGHSYYYTDIKGSKPIKDPRIGSHFGSQRHMFKSLQKLEQETATHGANVYSVDGREWLRAVGTVSTEYGDHTSSRVNLGADGSFFEITGYFNDANFLLYAGTNSNSSVVLNGGTAESNTGATASVASPLGGRYVDNSSLINLVFDTTPVLGINTIKIIDVSSHVIYATGIELIAQDTTSTATKSKVQIPSQNVVSYGKKFTVSGNPHYDPFNGFTSGNLAAVQALIDTDTSLGLANWLHSGSYYRPYNGGRVVRWVDSSGVIKTSVNMMPPNAQNVGGTAISAKANASVANDTYLPTFSGAIDHSLAEVAKTFHVREFGNGSANQGSNTSGTLQDVSMSNGHDNLAFVMDDGLTSMSVVSALPSSYIAYNGGIGANDGNYVQYITFIGTGISVIDAHNADFDKFHYAQNLPFGTHILKVANASSNGIIIDGITVQASGTSADAHSMSELSIYQPKMPPIPEDAVVISDYMLMADFVPQTAVGVEKISKGVRMCSLTRDGFYDSTSGNWSVNLHTGYNAGFYMTPATTASSDTDRTIRMPAFATNYSVRGNQMDLRAKLFVGTTDKDSASTRDNSVNDGSYAHLTSDEVLGVQNWGVNAVSGQNPYLSQMELASPIHTSSHYQTFETPFLNELVGGDRNMEQTNLVVTPDGKTWDEVTRDVGYLGNMSMRTLVDTNRTTANTIIVHDEWRGIFGSTSNTGNFNKDFAIAYDRVICLKDGEYQISYSTHLNAELSAGSWAKIKVNSLAVSQLYQVDANYNSWFLMVTTRLKRGDYVQLEGFVASDASFFEINRVS